MDTEAGGWAVSEGMGVAELPLAGEGMATGILDLGKVMCQLVWVLDSGGVSPCGLRIATGSGTPSGRGGVGGKYRRISVLVTLRSSPIPSAGTMM